MFDWLGYRQGLPLWISWRLNRNLKEDIEDIFEGIAETRKELLFSWSHEYWGHMDRLKEQLNKDKPYGSTVVGEHPHPFSTSAPLNQEQLFSAMYSRAADFTELFLLNPSGEVTYSTYASHIGNQLRQEQPFGRGNHSSRRLGLRQIALRTICGSRNVNHRSPILCLS